MKNEQLSLDLLAPIIRDNRKSSKRMLANRYQAKISVNKKFNGNWRGKNIEEDIYLCMKLRMINVFFQMFPTSGLVFHDLLEAK